MRQVLQVPEVHCDHCKTSLEDAVGGLAGVGSVDVAIAEATLTVDYDQSQIAIDQIKTTVEEQGYAVFG